METIMSGARLQAFSNFNSSQRKVRFTAFDAPISLTLTVRVSVLTEWTMKMPLSPDGVATSSPTLGT
jgi:hypothetical protein